MQLALASNALLWPPTIDLGKDGSRQSTKKPVLQIEFRQALQSQMLRGYSLWKILSTAQYSLLVVFRLTACFAFKAAHHSFSLRISQTSQRCSYTRNFILTS